MEKSNEVIVVIPVYRSMTFFERVSMMQCLRILGHYPIALFMGDTFCADEFLALHPFRVERFKDDYFKSQKGYNALCLSDEFYERFSDYEYMLIYQLDAFVFSNQLMKFCLKGYDYIGAPLLRGSWKGNRNRVGNGGFSLRNIKSCLRMLHDFPPEKVFSTRSEPFIYEDMYFAACADIKAANFKVPSMREAIEFSVDFDVFHCYRWMPKWLPFGCHAWDHADYWLWKPIIESQGYELPPVENDQSQTYRFNRCVSYLIKRFLRTEGSLKNKIMERILKLIPPKQMLAIWGWGLVGKNIEKVLSLAGRHVSVIFDKKAPGNETDGKAKFMKPDLAYIGKNKLFIVISTTAYEDEIADELSAHGLKEGKDYMRGTALVREITKVYMRPFAEAI